jgi:flavin-dependent dehydrogenase
MLDVVILGGGPAGAAAAIALARAGRSCVVIERHAEPPLRAGETLPPIARLPLESLGVWERFAAEGHTSAPGNRSLWGSDVTAENEFIRSPYGAGWHLERRRFESMLLDEAARAGSQLVRGREVSRIAHDGSTWRIDGFEARFAVDATGRAAVLARAAGVERVSIDQLIGITAFFCEARDDDRYTLIEAAEDGWWYAALLPDRRLVAAFMTDADIATRRTLREREAWLAEAAKTTLIAPRLASATLESEPRIASATSSRLASVAGPAWLAAGDAALSFDPLSSQGIDTALSCGLAAARAIDAHLRADDSALRKYAEMLTKIWTDYIVDRARYYGIERRWPHSVFWQRRQRSS